MSELIPISFPNFPPLLGDKTTRVVTKHFTNTVLYLPRNQLALLTWLIYISNVDNSFKYNTHLIRQFSQAVKFAHKEYGGKEVNTSIQSIRASFKTLVNNGYILSTYDKNILVINPMLSYRSEYVRPQEYNKFVGRYQKFGGSKSEVFARDWVIDYVDLVQSKLKKKKL